MGLITFILTLPLAPVRGVVAIGEIIREQVEQEMYSPAAIRAELEDIQRRHDEGLISDEEEARAEQAVLDRLTGGRSTGPGWQRGEPPP